MNKNNVSKFKEKRIYNNPLIIGIIVGMLIVSVTLMAMPMPSQLGIYNFVNKAISKTQLGYIGRIIFSAIAGGIIGFEREHKNRPAGLRTHALVSIGAAMVMLIPLELAYEGMDTSRTDVTRLGAQVISGIGFLGAGTIIRNGESVKGLTTAASLWVSAIIGLSIGAGNYMTSFVSLVIVIFILKNFGIFGHSQGLKYKELIFDLTMDDAPQHISLFNGTIKNIKRKFKLQKLEIIENSSDVIKNGNKIIQIKLLVRCSMNTEEEMLMSQLNNIPGVLKVDGNNLIHSI